MSLVGTSSSFLLVSSMPMCEYTTVHHSPVDGHLDCFQFGAVTDKVAMNIGVQVFLETDIFISLQCLSRNGFPW